MFDLLTAAFQDKYPQYRIETVTLGYGDPRGEIRDLAAKGETDLVSYRWSALQSVLMPLDPYIARAGLDLKPHGSMVDSLRMDGVLAQMPVALLPSLLVYNREVFRSAGVPEPAAGWTWDEFRQAARTLTAGSGERRAWGFATGGYDYLVRAYVEEKTGGPFWEAPPAVIGEALQFLGSMAHDDLSMPKPAADRTTNPGTASEWWQIDTTWGLVTPDLTMAMVLRPPASPGSLSELKWAIAPMPTHPGATPVSSGQPITMGIFQQAPHPDAAWEFIRFATGEEGATVLARAGFPSVYVSDAVRQAWAERPSTLPAGADSIYQARWVVSSPLNMNEFTRLLWLRWMANQTLSGAKTWDEALAEYTREFPQP